jgi:NAD(P)-dependent dehydrogenase (short-subunit alcohol dehydrogenase family)
VGYLEKSEKGVAMGKLDGKVALITGAGSGIGRAGALLFAKEGAKIVVADHAPVGGQETVKLIKEAAGDAVFVHADVSKSADSARMVQISLDTFARIDILYNNAGIPGAVTLTAELTEEAWDSVINTNLKGVFLGSKYAIPAMIRQGGGVIINTASIAALKSTPGMPAYSASKGGILQLTKTMALEYAKNNIRVNCICPGMVKTAMGEAAFPGDAAVRDAFIESFVQTIPLGRIGQPDEVAKAALYLASEDSSYVTGTALIIDGGAMA